MSKNTSVESKIRELESANAAMRKELKMGTKKVVKKSVGKVVSEKEMMDHLWKRCRNMESSEYFWFKQMSRVVSIYGKELSEKQRASFLPIWEKYKDTKETPKPKSKKEANPHK